MKSVKYILFSLASLMLSAGCSDFLNTEQRGVTSLEDFYQTDLDAEQALYAVYDKMQRSGEGTPGRDFFQWKIVLSDDAVAGGGGRGDNYTAEELDEFVFGPENEIITFMFTKFYQMIYMANLLIEKVSPDSPVKQQAIAEAKALRAFAYFELVTLWGPVPLVTKILDPTEYAQPNGEVSAIWAQIEQDLQEAIPVLPLRSQQSPARLANVSRGAAQAWLGKAYLFQEKFQEAAEAFEQVIQSNEYRLLADFRNITRHAWEFSEESLFEVSYYEDLINPEYTCALAYGGPRESWFKAGTSGITETGWHYTAPENDLYQAFIDHGETVRMYGSVWSEKELAEVGGSYRKADNSLPHGTEGYIRIKHGAYVDEFPNQIDAMHWNGGMNYRITRYADVLLMAAEALCRKAAPDNAKALGYVNQVRERAELPPLTSQGAQLFEDIKQERRFELAFEFSRYQDLLRWGDAAEALKDRGKRIPNGDGTYLEFPNAGFKKGRHELLPFPYTEMNVNPNLVQNPGY
ncbi:MAG: RagB/SusD family nutrient uptake outer membrane protein [Tannerellaceae bacterium]|jgi:tetratricopeptide (TPR) repeat protein|nr:RagB/SusD family nutrient uptake outer membrane protein [Tannerellaceae bacterium]